MYLCIAAQNKSGPRLLEAAPLKCPRQVIRMDLAVIAELLKSFQPAASALRRRGAHGVLQVRYKHLHICVDAYAYAYHAFACVYVHVCACSVYVYVYICVCRRGCICRCMCICTCIGIRTLTLMGMCMRLIIIYTYRISKCESQGRICTNWKGIRLDSSLALLMPYLASANPGQLSSFKRRYSPSSRQRLHHQHTDVSSPWPKHVQSLDRTGGLRARRTPWNTLDLSGWD